MGLQMYMDTIEFLTDVHPSSFLLSHGVFASTHFPSGEKVAKMLDKRLAEHNSNKGGM